MRGFGGLRFSIEATRIVTDFVEHLCRVDVYILKRSHLYAVLYAHATQLRTIALALASTSS